MSAINFANKSPDLCRDTHRERCNMQVGASLGIVKFHDVSLTALINTKLITINLTEAEQQSRHQLQLSALICQLSAARCTSWCGDVHQMNIYQGPKWRLPPRVPSPHSCVTAPQLVSSSTTLHSYTTHLIPSLHSFILQLTLR